MLQINVGHTVIEVCRLICKVAIVCPVSLVHYVSLKHGQRRITRVIIMLPKMANHILDGVGGAVSRLDFSIMVTDVISEVLPHLRFFPPVSLVLLERDGEQSV